MKVTLVPGFWDMAAGIPAGMLIFMATVLFDTLANAGGQQPEAAALGILALAALGTGTLAGITRLRRGPATGLAAGLVAAALLGFLWYSARPEDKYNGLVIGLPGMLAAVTAAPLGGWIGARLRKAL